MSRAAEPSRWGSRFKVQGLSTRENPGRQTSGGRPASASGLSQHAEIPVDDIHSEEYRQDAGHAQESAEWKLKFTALFL